MPTYVRSYRPERRPNRQRRRPDHDAARWTYAELDAAREPLRHIEMRADDGTFLAAVDHEGGHGVAPATLGADPQEMTADAFEELWRLARCQLNGEAEVWVEEVHPRTTDGLPVVVRYVGGRVRTGSRLSRVRETGEHVSFTVVRILRFDREVKELTPAHTAVLVLSGTDSGWVRAGHHLDGHTD